MMASRFHGERRHADSLLSGLERRFANRAVHCVPAWLESHHLTLLTAIWAGLIVLCSALVRADSRWLLAVSAVIVLQYLTDAIDGKVGVMRGAGLVRWGYYMDHLLDYVFLCAILIGYGLMLPERSQYLMTWTLAIAGGFMVNTFLEYGATGQFRLSYARLGPIEIRLIFISINMTLLTFGRASLLAKMPSVLLVAAGALVGLVCRTQRRLWRLDTAGRSRLTSVTEQPPLARTSTAIITRDLNRGQEPSHVLR
jgi:phosphatidylglycerophosphate synthase